VLSEPVTGNDQDTAIVCMNRIIAVILKKTGEIKPEGGL
jgi:hypothetical protein